MKKLSVLVSGVSLWAVLAHAVLVQAAQGPLLQIQKVSNQQIQLSWTSPTANFAVERSAAIFPSPLWQALAQTPTPQGDQFSLILPANELTGFYRLRQGQGIPVVPTHGKTGNITGVNATLINDGKISADVAGGTIRVTVTTFTNQGVLEAINGGTLVAPGFP